MLPRSSRARPSPKEVKTASKSPTRPKSPVKPKSPGRRKSQTRTKSPARPKSPARTKSPGRRKSPSRSATTKNTDAVPKSPSRSSARLGHLTPSRLSPVKRSPIRLFKEPDKARESSIPVEVPRKPTAPESESDSDEDERFHIRASIDEVEKVHYREPSTESSRSSVLRSRTGQIESDRIVHLTPMDPLPRKLLSQFSDDDEFLSRIGPEATEPSTLFPMLVLLSLPTLLLWLLLDRDFAKVRPADLFQPTPFLYYTALVLAIAILGLLPVPNYLDRFYHHKKLSHGPNGALCLAAALLAASPFYFDWQPVVLLLTRHELQLFTAALLTGVGIAVMAFLRSLWAPENALTRQVRCRSWLLQFIVGRQLQARLLFGYVDLKVLLVRLQVVSEVLLLLVWASRQYRPQPFLQLAPLLVYTIYRLYLNAQRLLLEKIVLSSKAIQQEGVGCYLSVSCLILPFLNVMPLRQLDPGHSLSPYHLAAVSVAFAFFLFTQLSNLRRLRSISSVAIFRCDPYAKTWLTTGLWGRVRHPDYLGAIVAELAAHSVLWPSPLALLGLVHVLLLVCQASRSDKLTRFQYQWSWDRYCNRVKYLLVPGVY